MSKFTEPKSSKISEAAAHHRRLSTASANHCGASRTFPAQNDDVAYPIERQRDITVQLNGLHENIDEMEKLAEVVGQSLASVVVAGPPANKAECPAPLACGSPIGESLGDANARLKRVRHRLYDLLDRLQLLLPFLLLIGFTLSAEAAENGKPNTEHVHHHYGWKSNPHHSQGLVQFVHHPKFSTAPAPDIVDLSGCMPDSGQVSAPLAVHMPAIYDQGVRNSWGTQWGCNGYCWEPMSEIENPQINEDFACIDVVAVPATSQRSTVNGQGQGVTLLKKDWDGLDIARRTEPERPEVWALTR